MIVDREQERRRVADAILAAGATAREEQDRTRMYSDPDDHTAKKPDSWPEPLRTAAYHGLAGRIVNMIEPHSESDPAALLVQLLVLFGNMIGRSAHWQVEADKHFTNLFAAIVGKTAGGRKGTSFGNINLLARAADESWAANRIMSGLSSGEGLLWSVRDPIEEPQVIKEKGRVTGTEIVEVDPGVSDKRLQVVEPEFARVLQVCERETNTLSAILRQAWDTGDLRVLTKKQSTRATNAHISIVAHITKNELRRLLSDTAVANGFANRFLYVCARRSKYLPEGGNLHRLDWAPILREFNRAVDFGKQAGLVSRDPGARELWASVYAGLAEGRIGLFGSVTARAEAQVMRLACVYALLDASDQIRVEHLQAGLELWRYCEDSVRYIFGAATGNTLADEILSALKSAPGGMMTRSELREHFQRHKSKDQMDSALSVLEEHGLARCESEKTGGRPLERWYAVRHAPKAPKAPKDPMEI